MLRKIRHQLVFLVATAAHVVFLESETAAQSNVLAWGRNASGECAVPSLPPGLTYVEVNAAWANTAARRSDGSIVSWGDGIYGMTSVPPLPAGLAYVELAGNYQCLFARRSDGSVIGWGWNFYGQCNVPALPLSLTYVEVAGGQYDAAARLSDGSIAQWGAPVGSVPALPIGLAYAEIAVGDRHYLARRSDGSVVAWGTNYNGECNVPAPPLGLTYIGLSAGNTFSVGLLSDGSAIAWGINNYGQCNVPALPPGLRYVQVDAGFHHTVARRSDGSVVAWGKNNFGQCNVPVLPPNLSYAEISADSEHTVARLELSTGCPQTIPTAPSMLVAIGIAGTRISLSWTDNSANEDGFTIERADFGSGLWSNVGTTGPDASSFLDTTVTCSNAYDYRVDAFNCAGHSGATNATTLSAPCVPPATYCTAKINSLGCVPSIGWTGTATSSGPIDDFYVSASSVLNQKPGLMIWSTQPGAMPFGGGTLCIAPPVIRTPGQASGGNPAPVIDCTGQYSFHFGHAYIQNYLLAAGQTIRAQYWSRDPGSGPPHTPYNIGLTNALSFVIGP